MAMATCTIGAQEQDDGCAAPNKRKHDAPSFDMEYSRRSIVFAVGWYVRSAARK